MSADRKLPSTLNWQVAADWLPVPPTHRIVGTATPQCVQRSPMHRITNQLCALAGRRCPTLAANDGRQLAEFLVKRCFLFIKKIPVEKSSPHIGDAASDEPVSR